jgi:carboxylesterase
MGGVLSLYHASFLPVDGVISMSAPYQVEPDPRLKILPLYARLIPYAPKGESDWQDPNAVEDHFSYDLYPTKALIQLTRLLHANRENLSKIKAPALLIHARKDIGVPLHNLDHIYQAIGTTENQKRKIVFENSGHVLTRDMDKDQVFEEIHKFIQDVLGHQT